MNQWQAAVKQDEVFTMPTAPAEKPFQNDVVIEAQTDNPLAKFDIQQAAINTVKTFSSVVVDVENPATVKDAKDKKKITRDLRLKVQRREKAIDAGYIAQRKALKKDANAIYSDIKPVEDHLSTEIQKDIDHKAKLAEKARIEEAARVAKIDANMRILTGYCEDVLADGLTGDEISMKLKNLEATELPRGVFQEKYQDACSLLAHAVEAGRAKMVARFKFEEEQAEVKKQQDINDQVAWFNRVFGFAGTLEGMEKGLEVLEDMEPDEHLAELIEQQKIQAQDIVVAARAAQAEKDRVAAEKAYSDDWDDAHAMNEAWAEAEKVYSDNWEVAPGIDAAIVESDPEPEPKSEAVKTWSEIKPQPLDDAAAIRSLFLDIKEAFYKPALQSVDASRVWIGINNHMDIIEKNVVDYLKTMGSEYDL